MKKFTIDDLATCNGKDDNPLYVAYDSKVYDLSKSDLWKGGVHMNRHKAGNDLTSDIRAAPHSPEHLERFPQVGVLEKESVPEPSIPKPVSTVLDHFPILRRHPHPMVVHFPIVFSFSTVVFIILYFISGIQSFETTAVHCLGGAVLFTPVAMLTGWLTWWLNYQSKPMRPVTIKIWLSFLLWFLQIIVFIWHILNPTIFQSLSLSGVIHLLFVLSFAPIVTVVGWYGATLTFPVEKT